MMLCDASWQPVGRKRIGSGSSFHSWLGLGRSQMSQKFGIASKAEARSYLEHSILGPRLRECTRLMLAVPDRSIGSILGYPDDLKFRSSMTLFAAAAPEESLFEAALEKFFGGERDPLTIRLLRQNEQDSNK